MSGLFQDLRYALRTFRNRPTFAAVAILTLAIGIGANTTIFSWLRSLVLNPFPGAFDPGRIVAIENNAPDREPITTSYLDFRDFRNNLRLVKSFTEYRGYLFSVGEAPYVERAGGERGSASYADRFGIRPEGGRSDIPEEEEVAQTPRSAGLTIHQYWKSQS